MKNTSRPVRQNVLVELLRLYKKWIVLSSVTCAVFGVLFGYSFFRESLEPLSNLLFFSFVFAGVVLSITWFITSVSKYSLIKHRLLPTVPFLCWQYSEIQWNRWNELQRELYKRHDHFPWLFLAVTLCVFAACVFWIFHIDDFLFLACLFSFLIFATILQKKFRSQFIYRRNLTQVALVQIWDGSLFTGSVLYTWQTRGARLERIELLSEIAEAADFSTDMQILRFQYSVRAKATRNQYYVYVPVPENQTDTVTVLLSHFKKILLNESSRQRGVQ